MIQRSPLLSSASTLPKPKSLKMILDRHEMVSPHEKLALLVFPHYENSVVRQCDVLTKKNRMYLKKIKTVSFSKRTRSELLLYISKEGK